MSTTMGCAASHASAPATPAWRPSSPRSNSDTRVVQRVAPEEKIRARFKRTQRNIAAALQFVDLGFVIDNSSTQHPYDLVEHWDHRIRQEQPQDSEGAKDDVQKSR
jgi:hypothetical protein